MLLAGASRITTVTSSHLRKFTIILYLISNIQLMLRFPQFVPKMPFQTVPDCSFFPLSQPLFLFFNLGSHQGSRAASGSISVVSFKLTLI